MNNQLFRVFLLVIATYVISIFQLAGQTTYIGGTIFVDANNDGFHSPGELSLGEVGKTSTIELFNSSGQLIATTTTDADGEYFLSTAPGDYYIEFMPPSSHAISSGIPVTEDNDVKGDNNGIQGDTDNNMIKDGIITSPMINLSIGAEPTNETNDGGTNPDEDTNQTIDFGLLACRTISGSSFIDLDIDGCRGDSDLENSEGFEWKIFLCDTSSSIPSSFGEGILMEEYDRHTVEFQRHCYTAQNTFYMEVTPPNGLLITSANADCPDDMNSDFSFITGQTDCFVIDGVLDTDHIDLGLDPISSTNDVSREIELSFSPNPVQEIVEVKTEEAITSIKVYNLTGQLVVQRISQKQSNNVVLNLSHLASGAYVISVSTARGRAMERLVKL